MFKTALTNEAKWNIIMYIKFIVLLFIVKEGTGHENSDLEQQQNGLHDVLDVHHVLRHV